MRLVMMGTGSFAEPTFLKLLDSPHEVAGLVTQPDRATGKERGSTRQARQGMKEIALERGIPVLQPESINTPDGVAALQTLKPDLLVVAAYGQILSKDVLAIPPLGGINVHASLLPEYRGAAPINWAIYHGKTYTGVTIIRMSIALDAGDILTQKVINILPEETAGELEARLGPLGAKLALKTVDRLAQGPISGTPQDKTQATKAPKLTKEHGLIDWSRDVSRQIRAMQPWPTAYTFLHRPGVEPLRLIIYKVAYIGFCEARSAVIDTHASARSIVVTNTATGDTFTHADFPGRLFVAGGCSTHASEHDLYEILELQPAGKRRMAAQEFLRGNPIPEGSRMGGETLA